MEITVSFKQLSPKDDIKEYVTEKCERFKKYFNGKIHLTWTFSHEKDEMTAHCHLVGNHMDYFGESKAENLFASSDAVIDKIERQIKKKKEIVKDHHQQVNPTKAAIEAKLEVAALKTADAIAEVEEEMVGYPATKPGDEA